MKGEKFSVEDVKMSIKKESENMTSEQVFEQVRKNILGLDWSMIDASYHGFTSDQIRGVKFAVNKVLEGTGITINSLKVEEEEKRWFRG